MKRATGLLATAGLMSISPLMFAQVAQIPNPPSLSDILGPTLISWSEQQQPQPLPDSPGEQQPAAPANPQTEQQPAVQSFTGVVSKDNTCQLHDQQKARQTGPER
jgi:hypothetical protein